MQFRVKGVMTWRTNIYGTDMLKGFVATIGPRGIKLIDSQNRTVWCSHSDQHADIDVADLFVSDEGTIALRDSSGKVVYQLDLNWVPAINSQSNTVLNTKKYLASNGCDSVM